MVADAGSRLGGEPGVPPAVPSLRVARLRLGLTSRDVAEAVGVTTACLLRWERRQRKPGPAAAAALAAVLGLEPEHLDRFFAESSECPLVDDSLPAFGIRALRKRRQVPAERIAESLGVTTRTVYRWERGGSRLPIRLVAPLAGSLGMEADELIGALRSSPRGPRAIGRPSGELAGLRGEAGHSQAGVAELLGVSRTTVRGWENGSVVPPWPAIRQMAALYGVSVTVLAKAAKAGGPELLAPDAWRPGDLARVLRLLRRWNGLTQAEVARQCDVSTGSVRGWEHGRQQPGSSARRGLEALYRLPDDALLRAYG